jgi:hypothetical protein
MRKTVLKFMIVAGVFSCGDDPICVPPPCAFPIALIVSIHTASSQSGVAGAFARTPSTSELSCTGGSIAPCAIPGYAGTYELDVGAPGFQTVHRTVQVSGGTRPAGCATCPTAETQRVDVVLVPIA